jgi:antitoxin component YwqK of YwqJK toxin-antitoxin module
MGLFDWVVGNNHHVEYYSPEEGGGVRDEGDYKKWKKYGLWTYWYENGQKREEGNVKDDKEEGLWTWWGEDGNFTRTEIYKDGVEVQ